MKAVVPNTIVIKPRLGKIHMRLVDKLRLRVAVDAHRYTRAVSAAEELLAEAPPEARTSLEDVVRDLFQRAPKRSVAVGGGGTSASCAV